MPYLTALVTGDLGTVFLLVLDCYRLLRPWFWVTLRESRPLHALVLRVSEGLLETSLLDL